MDVSLTFAEMLRAKGVVGCFVECFGAGLDGLSATAAFEMMEPLIQETLDNTLNVVQ